MSADSATHATLDGDVNAIVQQYFSTLAEKDDDMLKLYEDNMRMRDLAETTLAARQELDARLGTQSLLVEALRTELTEKQLLLQAQDAESAVLRDGVAALRTMLRQPAELGDGSMDNLLKCVASLLGERDAFRSSAARAEHSAAVAQSAHAQLLVEEESRQRRTLETLALGPLTVAEATAMKDLCAFAARLTVESEAAALQSAKDFADAEERIQLAEAHAAGQMERASRSLELAQEHCFELRARVGVQALEVAEAQARAASVTEGFMHGYLPVLQQRVAIAESALALAVLQIKEAAQQQHALSAENAKLQGELNAATSAQQAALAKLRRQREKDEAVGSQLAAAQSALAARVEELAEAKQKGVVYGERLLALRAQQKKGAEAAQENLRATEEQLRQLQHRVQYLEQRAESLQDDNKTKAKAAHALQRKCEQTAAAAQAAEATASQDRQRLEEQHRRQLETAAAETASAAAECAERQRVEEEKWAAKLAEQSAASSAQLLAAQAAHQRDQDRFKHEVQEWTTVVDGLREELQANRTTLDRERAARAVLEQQRQAEQLFASKLTAASRQSSAMDERDADKTEQLQQRVRVLEKACRRSAEVIAQLRESTLPSRLSSRVSFGEEPIGGRPLSASATRSSPRSTSAAITRSPGVSADGSSLLWTPRNARGREQAAPSPPAQGRSALSALIAGMELDN